MNKKIKILLLLVLSFSIVSANAMELPDIKWTKNYKKYSGDRLTGQYSDYMYDYNSGSGALLDNVYFNNGSIIVVDSSIGRHKTPENGGNYNERIITSYNSKGQINWEEKYTLTSFQFYKNYLFLYNKYDGDVMCIELSTGKVKYIVETGSSNSSDIRKILIDDDYIYLVEEDNGYLYVDKVDYSSEEYEFKTYELKETYPSDLLESYDSNKRISLSNNNIIVVDKNTITTINVNDDSMHTIERSDKYPVNKIGGYSNGILICGTKDGHPIIQYIEDEVKWTIFKEGNGKYNSFDFNDNEIVVVGGIFNNSELNNTNKMLPLVTSISSSGTENYSKVLNVISSDNPIQIYGVKLYNDSIAIHGDDAEESWRYSTTNAFTTLFRNNNPLAITYYNIETNIIGDGLVLVDSPNRNDDVIKYTIKGDLISLNIKTKSGQEIEINDDNSFIMPDEDVIITAKFKNQTNPKTSRNIIIAISALLLITIITALTLLFRKKKLNSK